MRSRWWSCVAAVVCGCSSSTPKGGPPVPADDGELRWVGADGELVGALHADRTIEGPCGRIGTVDGEAIAFPDRKVSYAGVAFADGVVTLNALPFELRIAASGAVTRHPTTAGDRDTPAGAVTGTLSTDDGRRRLRALAAAVTLNQVPMVDLVTIDAPPALLYRFDRRGVLDAKGNPIWYAAEPDEPPRDHVVDRVAVTRVAGGFAVDLGPATTGALAKYRTTHVDVRERADGTLTFGDTPFAKLEHRLACHEHDRQATLLLAQLFYPEASVGYLREHGLPEPPLPPPPPPPRPR